VQPNGSVEEGERREDAARDPQVAATAPVLEAESAIATSPDVGVITPRSLAWVLESISDAFVALDRDWRFTYVNARAEQLLQRPFAAVQGRKTRDVLPDFVNTRFHTECRRAEESGRPVHFEEYFAPRGTWVGVNVYPSTDGLTIYFQDITERKRTEAALTASERRYRSLVASSAQVIFAANARGEVDDLPSWRALTGQSRDEVRGTGWMEAIVEEDRDRTRTAWQNAIARGDRCEVLYRVRTADGAQRHLFHRTVPIVDDRGEVVEWVGTCADITERKLADEWRAFLADASRMLGSSLDVRTTLANLARLSIRSLADYAIVYLLGPDGSVQATEAVHGDPVRAAALDRLVSEYPLDTRGQHPLALVLRTGQSGLRARITDDELRQLSVDDVQLRLMRELQVCSGLNLALVARGRTLGALALRRSDPARAFTDGDLTWAEELASRAAQALDNALLYQDAELARREAEAARLEAERMRRAAEGANLAKSEFLAVMSHELRTPLNAIGGYADLLEMGVRGPVNLAQQEDLRRIKRSGSHLLGLLNEILSFARIEAGRVQLDLRAVPVLEPMLGAEALVMPQARSRGLRLERLPSPTGLALHGDADKVQQILLNLLTNAVKFTAPGGTITLAARRDGGHVALRVSDTGRGIPEDKLEWIFEPFVQVDARLSREHEGVGLGLAISRDLARAMGGDLVVSSVVGEGSTFELRLPVAEA
jgi:PAS domain S-box-containing protein